jgi:hypothetical protein
MSQNIQVKENIQDHRFSTILARRALVASLFTFMAARIIVFMIMSRRLPDLYLHLEGTHIHHLNYGIFMLVIVGGGCFFGAPEKKAEKCWRCYTGSEWH